jgi:hypothetical protein
MRQLAKVSPAPRKRDGAGAGHEAHTEEAQRSVQSCQFSGPVVSVSRSIATVTRRQIAAPV